MRLFRCRERRVLLCAVAFALSGCIEGLPAESGDGSVDSPLAVADHSHEERVRDGSISSDVGATASPDLASIADLQAALDGFVQALGGASGVLCTCLVDTNSPACQAQPESCFYADYGACTASWTHSQSAETCLLEALTPHAADGVTALECMEDAAQNLESCLVAAECSTTTFECIDTFEQTSVACIIVPGGSVVADIANCLEG